MNEGYANEKGSQFTKRKSEDPMGTQTMPFSMEQATGDEYADWMKEGIEGSENLMQTLRDPFQKLDATRADEQYPLPVEAYELSAPVLNETYCEICKRHFCNKVSFDLFIWHFLFFIHFNQTLKIDTCNSYFEHVINDQIWPELRACHLIP